VDERTVGLSHVLAQLARSPHPSPPSADWHALTEEIETSPHSSELDGVIQAAAEALRAISNGMNAEGFEADLFASLGNPEAAAVLNTALVHVLPGDVALFQELRRVLSQRFRAPLGDRILS
jgi:hypothetical protein